jgi:hypothetical protein
MLRTETPCMPNRVASITDRQRLLLAANGHGWDQHYSQDAPSTTAGGRGSVELLARRQLCRQEFALSHVVGARDCSRVGVHGIGEMARTSARRAHERDRLSRPQCALSVFARARAGVMPR